MRAPSSPLTVTAELRRRACHGRMVCLGLVACLGLFSSCRDLVFTNDCAICSEKGDCPPGQRCSADGYCLFPCPEEGCSGAPCGCEPRVGDGGQMERICLEDGLCHLLCPAPDNRCLNDFVCDLERGECVRECDLNEDEPCPPGSVCVSTPGVTDDGSTKDITVCREL